MSMFVTPVCKIVIVLIVDKGQVLLANWLRTIFPAGYIEQRLLIGIFTHQPVDGDLFALANAVAPGHGLQVVLQKASRQ